MILNVLVNNSTSKIHEAKLIKLKGERDKYIIKFQNFISSFNTC